MVPYAFSATFGPTTLPLWERLTGSGQLVITSFALLGVVLRDSLTWHHLEGLKEAITALGALYAIFVGLFYSYVLDRIGEADAQALGGIMHSTMLQSLAIYGVTVVTAFTLVVAGTPPPGQGA